MPVPGHGARLCLLARPPLPGPAAQRSPRQSHTEVHPKSLRGGTCSPLATATLGTGQTSKRSRGARVTLRHTTENPWHPAESLRHTTERLILGLCVLAFVVGLALLAALVPVGHGFSPKGGGWFIPAVAGGA